MADTSYYVRNMLLHYDKQLVTARRLARYRRSKQSAESAEALAITRETKRKQMVERVAKEIIENLLIVGSANPIVDEIREDLQREFNERFIFEYPIMEQDLLIYRETPDGPVELDSQDKMQVLNKLWTITLDKVDTTML